jgi:hypothetical protein
MRINLSSVLILTAVFVACGGTGDNFGDGGDEGGGGFGGSDGAGGSFGAGGAGGTNGTFFDGSTGEDVFTKTDGTVPKEDAGECSMTCKTNSFCQSACGSSSTYCCDVPTGACYPTSASTCPKEVDASTDSTMPY